MISPGPLFWRLSRNSEDVEFQEGSVLSSAHASFKVVRQMGQDWRGHPMARLRVVAAGFLGTKYLHKGTMYLAKIVPARAVETCRCSRLRKASVETFEASRRSFFFFARV